jgi:hypothetical protein
MHPTRNQPLVFAMTGRLAEKTHRRQRSITRAVVPGSILKAILPAMWASGRRL